MNQYEISVIIPCFCSESRHDWSRLYLTLLGFSIQTLENKYFEIIIVDDGSEWDIKGLVKKWSFDLNIKVLWQPHKGMCSAYKAGNQAAQGKYIFLGIDDNIPSATLLEEHLSDLLSQKNVVVWGREYHMRQMKKIFNPISGKLKHLKSFDCDSLIDEKNVIKEKEILQDFQKIILRAEIIDKYKDIESTIENCKELTALCAPWLIMRVGNQSLSRHLLEKSGGIDVYFDPSGWYMDLELGLRLFKEGAVFKLNKNAVMVHLSHEREEVALSDEIVKHSYFYEKHPEAAVALLPFFFKSGLSIVEYCKYVQRITPYFDKR